MATASSFQQRGRGGGPRGRGGAPPSRWGGGPPHGVTSPRGSPAPPRPGQALAPAAASAAGTANAFPSLGSTEADEAHRKMRDRMLFLLVSLVGNTVVVTARGGTKYVGILSAASTESGEMGVVLASAQELLPASDAAPTDGATKKSPLGPVKKMLLIAARDLDEIEAADVRLGDREKEVRESREREAFRTDTEISKSAFDPTAGGRTLQKWSDDPGLSPLDTDNPGGLPAWAAPSGNSAADGGLTASEPAAGGWDQFAANEAKFGIKSDYEETLYTTKLDRSGKDFKERERKAERLAREIMGASTTNTHIAEERGLADNSGENEEDRYGAVFRGPGAYVPPAARRAAAGASKTNGASPSPATVPVSSAPAPSAEVPPSTRTDEITSQQPATAGPSPSEQVAATDRSLDALKKAQMPADTASPLMGDFRQFVSSERERLERKKAALAKKEKDSKLADLKSWADNFKLKTPMPADVASVIHRDPKAVTTSTASDKPRDPSLQKSLSPTAAHMASASTRAAGDKGVEMSASTGSVGGSGRAAGGTASVHPSPSGGSGAAATTGAKVGPRFAETKAMLANMTIPKIPPFNPERAKARQAAAAAAAAGSSAALPVVSTEVKAPAAPANGVVSSASSFKLSAKASAFKPFNPNAAAFTPGAAAAKKPEPSAPASAAAAPAPTPVSAPAPAPAATAVAAAATAPPNPFFGNRVLKRPSAHSPIHVREDFNPFKVSKVPESSAVGPMWAFSGKPYRQLFVAAMPPAPGVPMAPGASFDENAGGMPPHIQQGPPAGPHPGQPQQPHQPPPPHAGPQPGGPGPQQPYGMVYQPYSPYRFHGQQQHMVQQMPMPNAQGGPMPYGAMPPQFMGQMPFSPPMPPHAAPPSMYSPQMANMPPPGQHGQFMPQGSPAGPHGVGPPAAQSGPPRPGQVPPPHLQKGPPPQHHMYYQQPGPMPGMPYPPHFMQPQPGPGRPQGGGPPPMEGGPGPGPHFAPSQQPPPGSGGGGGAGGAPPMGGGGAAGESGGGVPGQR